jgi:hypothetical protein
VLKGQIIVVLIDIVKLLVDKKESFPEFIISDSLSGTHLSGLYGGKTVYIAMQQGSGYLLQLLAILPVCSTKWPPVHKYAFLFLVIPLFSWNYQIYWMNKFRR